jgi:threonine/homoserine/homoserine lactone efflux protein
MLSFLVLGIVLGLSAGLAPGPVLTLVISETLQHGARAGMMVAIAPLLTDAPLILLTLALLSRLAELDGVLGVLSLVGGGFVLFLGWRTLGIQGVRLDRAEPSSRSLTKGMLANLLSPHPYLFWSSVGAPVMAKAMSQSPGALPVFLISFYAFLVGAKIALALLVGRSRAFMSGRVYLYTLRGLGLVLMILGLVLMYEGGVWLGWIDG